MQYRKLGRTGFDISEIGYGAWGISGAQWLGASDEESRAALRLAIDLGLNFIDTALAYGDGHSEQLVGRAVREAGRKIYVATKVPPKNMLWPDVEANCRVSDRGPLPPEVLGTLKRHAWDRNFYQ